MAALGLLAQHPASGYDLLKKFEEKGLVKWLPGAAKLGRTPPAEKEQ